MHKIKYILLIKSYYKFNRIFFDLIPIMGIMCFRIIIMRFRNPNR